MAMLRVTSSKVFPHAVRAISSGRALCGSITNTINGCDQVAISSHHHFFSTDASDEKKEGDRKLIKLLKSEIKMQKMYLGRGMPPIPSDFPFTVKEDSDDNIIFTREFDGEKIEVVVDMPEEVPEDESDSDSDISSEDDDDVSSSDEEKEEKEEEKEKEKEKGSLSLTVTVSKIGGKISEFEVSVSADEIKVDSFLLKEPVSLRNDEMQTFGPHEVEDEGDLQVALGEFLKVRGIDKNNYEFLYNYAVKKFRIRPVVAMKKLRNFISE